MSSLPGLDLESFVAWTCDLIVDGDGSANASLQIAHAVGVTTHRRHVTIAQFRAVCYGFEPYRDRIERAPSRYDDEDDHISWRDYAGSAFDFISETTYANAYAIVENIDRFVSAN